MNTYLILKILSFMISVPCKLMKGAEAIETVMCFHSILYNIIRETHSEGKHAQEEVSKPLYKFQ